MIDWYFDFISPYAYLQFAAHSDLMQRPDVRLRPVLFAGLLAHWGHKGPAEIPAKRVHTYRQCVWIAAERGVPLRFPPGHPFNPVHVLRLALARRADYVTVKTIFEFIWVEGRSPGAELGALAERLGIGDTSSVTGEPALKAALRANGEEAIAAGVWGVPTFVVGGAIFWGEDTTALLRAHLAGDTRLRAAEYARVRDLPVEAARS